MAVSLNPNIQTAYAQSFKAKESGEKKTGGVGKAIASHVCPGAGQLIDGRVGAGLGFLGAWTGLLLGTAKVFKPVSDGLNTLAKTLEQNSTPLKQGMKEIFTTAKTLAKDTFKNASVLKKTAMIALPIAFIGTHIANVVDAYKGGKK